MRGKKFAVKQQFAEGFEPDRVAKAFAMVEAMKPAATALGGLGLAAVPEAVDNPYEAIKIIEAWRLNFNLGTVAKYICRAGKKNGNSTIQDLRKARFYLAREIATLEATGADKPA